MKNDHYITDVINSTTPSHTVYIMIPHSPTTLTSHTLLTLSDSLRLNVFI